VATIFKLVNSYFCTIQALTPMPHVKLNYMFIYCATFRRIKKIKSNKMTSTLLSNHLIFAAAIFISPCKNNFYDSRLNTFFINIIGTCLKIFSFIYWQQSDEAHLAYLFRN